MTTNHFTHGYDISFIGSGISTSFTLLHFINDIEKQKITRKTYIAIIDKYPEFNTGIPYGSRSGFSTLLITSLRNFLPEPELSEFIEWLNSNKKWLLEEFRKEGGELSKEWLSLHAKEIQNKEWEDIFIPRRFFGCYIDQKVKGKIKALEEQNLIHIDYVTSKVMDLEKDSETWRLILKNDTVITSKTVILAVGSLPTKYLWKNKSLIENKNLLFINEPYKPELNKTLYKIKKFLAERGGKETNVAIIGANASGLELLYKLNDDVDTASNMHKFTIISTQGLLPDSEIDWQKLRQYHPVNLKSLERKVSLTAKEIAEATFNDLENASDINLGAASTVGIVSSAFGSLLRKLDQEELENFACFFGNEIGRRQRCAGVHYSNTVKKLKENKRFDHIAGRFSDMKKQNDNEHLLEYLDTKTKQSKLLGIPVHIVINCVGSITLGMPKIPKLLKNLIHKKFIVPNRSNIGFRVNDHLEAFENLHVMGPLLAGNVIENKAVWHVEHCGRIIWLSRLLAAVLVEKQALPENRDQLELRVLRLRLEEDRLEYTRTIKNQWLGNPYYSYDYFSHHKSDMTEIIVFELKKGDESLAIMPMIKRIIPDTADNYFDVTSPYGYNGPLFKDQLELSTIDYFWKEVDTWYADNNIITEFVRFSLTGNYKNYSGQCTKTLKNVQGRLLDKFENQWLTFTAKVRNNYRRAVNHNLRFAIYENQEITQREIQVFYDIYVSTMIRNKAPNFLFFSLEYFTELVSNNSERFSLAMVYVDEIAVSTELIINHANIIHAFLGGTNAEYFTYRPNDFLRVEVIKWAIGKQKKFYILGGGIKDFDGLYKSKKSFFPKDEDVLFYTGRKIINHTAYKKCNERATDDTNTEITEFFPLYRKPD